MKKSDKKKTDYMDTIKAQGGLSLIELVVVIAIMSVLVGLVAPAFVKNVQDNKKKACRQNREAILNIFARTAYDTSTTIKLDTEGLKKIMPATTTDATEYNPTENEVLQYNNCPLKQGTYKNDGKYGVNEATHTAWIVCDDCGDTVSIDLLNWNSSNKVLAKDEIKTPAPTTPPVTPTATPTPTPIPTPTPTPYSKNNSKWPYPDDETWWNPVLFNHDDAVNGKQLNSDNAANTYIDLKTPYRFTDAGSEYVLVNQNEGHWRLYQGNVENPALYADGTQPLVKLTGTEFEYDLSKYTDSEIYLTGLITGDVLKVKDTGGNVHEYVFWHTGSENVSIDVSSIVANGNKIGNFYRMPPAED